MGLDIAIYKKIKKKFRFTKDTHECLFDSDGSYFFKRKSDDSKDVTTFCYPPKYVLHFNGIFENCKKYSCAEALKGLEKIKEHINPKELAKCKAVLEQYKYTQCKEVFFIVDW
jgi:hypothetical protein